jgi:hypothetical protein
VTTLWAVLAGIAGAIVGWAGAGFGRAHVSGYQQLEPSHPNPHLVVMMNGKTQEFSLALPVQPGVAADWSEWRTLDDMRLRYRVNLFP